MRKVKFVVLPSVLEQRNEVIKFKLVAAFKTQTRHQFMTIREVEQHANLILTLLFKAITAG